MFKTIIIDDEPNAVKVLRLLLDQHCPEVEIIGTAENINDGYKLIIEKKPQLIFLDINMPNGNGVELLERIQFLNTNVVLTTAHQQFAIEALRLSALDYLLKPISKNDLITAVNRLHKKKDQSDAVENTPDTPKISIKTIDGLVILNLKDILFIQSDKNYSVFHFGDEKVVSSKSLGEYEDLLSDLEFIRIHRSTIVQLSHIRELKKGKNWSVILSNKQKLEVSRNSQIKITEALDSL